MSSSLLWSLHSFTSVNSEIGVGLHVKKKTNAIGHSKVAEGLIVASSKKKPVKKMRREEKKPKSSYMRSSSLTQSGKEKETDFLQNSANLDPNKKLAMVDENGASYADVKSENGSLYTPGRVTVLKVCVVTSGIFSGIALTIRQVSHIISEAGLSFPDCTRTMPLFDAIDNLEWSQAEMIAALIVLISSCRQLLLFLWPEFAESSKAANRQVLEPLDIFDYAVVSFLPGISEELLFRGVLLPLIGLDWKGMTISGITFGALHLGGGRKAAFALWASFVGIVYGFAAISSSSLIVPIAAHSLNNLIGGLLWRYSDKKGNGNIVD